MSAPDLAIFERLQRALAMIADTFDGSRALPAGSDLRQFVLDTAIVAEAQASAITGKSYRVGQ